MKTILLLVIITGFISCTDHKPSAGINNKRSASSFEKSIYRLFSEMSSERDSLEQINIRLVDTLVSYRSVLFDFKTPVNNPDSIYLPFFITISSDKQLCIVSWDTQQGGTMIDYSSMVFFKTPGGIMYKPLIEVNNGDTTNSLIYYDTTVTLQQQNRKIYLARGFGQGSSALPWENISAFEIVNNELKEPLIFPDQQTKTEAYYQEFDTVNRTKNIFIEFDLQYCNDSFYTNRPVTLFANDNTVLKVPKVSTEGGNTTDYFTLEFNGERFLERKKSK